MLTRELLNRIVDVLLPEMGDAEDRRALVEGALYGCAVLQKIQWEGPTRPFTVRLVRLLDEFGECTAGTPAIVALLEEVRRQVGADRQVELDSLLTEIGASASISSPQKTIRPRQLELAYLERLRLEELLHSGRYTPMGGASQQKHRRAEMRAVFELLPIGKDFRLLREPRRFEDAVDEIQRIRRTVLLGEPGAGKTTTIWKLASDLVEKAHQDPEAPIPLLIRLGLWIEANQSLTAFIASQLGKLGESLDLLLSEEGAALLLDGLNELPREQREIKYPLVKQLIEQHPKLMAIVSCRELDYTIDLGFDRINITPLDPRRIRDFVGRYLDEERGEALFWRLAGGDDVQAVWEVWRRAGASFDLFWTAPDIPRENPNIYGMTSVEHDHIWREKVRGKHSLMELARNPYMLWMLTSVYDGHGDLPQNRGELFRLFVEMLLEREKISEGEDSPLISGLAEVAYSMQVRRTGNKTADALTVLPRREVDAILNERQVYLAGSAGILSLGEQIRFTHQLLQEYFAARYMQLELNAGRLNATDLWPPDRWWERTNWEEATILLAGMHSDDCSHIVEWVAKANPEVAAMCVVRSGARFAEAGPERLRAHWIPRLTDLKSEPEPHARAAVGRALGMTGWDNRKGVGTVVNRDGVALPDIDWVQIPAGDFKYGDRNEYAAEPQKLTLPAFHISRYPVTYTQFQAFLNDPEGCANHQWFDGLAAREEDRGMEKQYFEFANHPRETVNWYQAMAFCRWFSWRLGAGYDLTNVGKWMVRLPTEHEWEKAARGTDGRVYPYGNKFDLTKCNTYETGLGQTSAVGVFPNGASPYGVLHMSGNVWEWCLSNYEKPSLDVNREDLGTDEWRVLRGGSWFFNHVFARAVYRYYSHPAGRDDFVGFRVVCCGVRPPSL